MKSQGLIIGLVVAAVLLFIGYGVWQAMTPGKYDAFAQCLGKNGATFYGAFWCPHCQAQKAMFGKSKDELPYVECSTPDGQGRTQVCTDKDINGYPTWEFVDGSRLSGEVPLAQLAEKTGCALP
jgi:thiol-disulfide isomerase/thioredoxin